MLSNGSVEYKNNGYKGEIRKEYASEPFIEFLDDIENNVSVRVDRSHKDSGKTTTSVLTPMEVPSTYAPMKVMLRQEDFTKVKGFGKFARSAFKSSGGLREFRALIDLITGGVLVPEPIAYIEKRSITAVKRSFFFMQYVSASKNLAELLEDSDDRVRLIVQAGDLARLLHTLDYSHGDMQASSFIVTTDGERPRLYMINTEGIKHHKTLDKMTRMKDLLHFARSVDNLADEDLDMLLSGYGKNIKAVKENITPRELRQFYYSDKK